MRVCITREYLENVTREDYSSSVIYNVFCFSSQGIQCLDRSIPNCLLTTSDVEHTGNLTWQA